MPAHAMPCHRGGCSPCWPVPCPLAKMRSPGTANDGKWKSRSLGSRPLPPPAAFTNSRLPIHHGTVCAAVHGAMHPSRRPSLLRRSSASCCLMPGCAHAGLRMCTRARVRAAASHRAWLAGCRVSIKEMQQAGLLSPAFAQRVNTGTTISEASCVWHYAMLAHAAFPCGTLHSLQHPWTSSSSCRAVCDDGS